jgi:hypothetical protein
MDSSQAGISLLFAEGKRPSANDIERLLASADIAGAAAHVSYRSADDAEGMLELLVSGLTFDLCGLAPARPCTLPPRAHDFGLNGGPQPAVLEAITLVPGLHLSGGFAMIPVVQAMLGLIGHIALPLAVEAVCWHPARSWMEPQYFSRLALGWLSGGAFPALGLTALADTGDGVRSEGLAFFAGQELLVSRREDESAADAAKLAVRFIDYVVSNGPLRREIDFEGPDGGLLRVTQADYGKLLIVRRIG